MATVTLYLPYLKYCRRPVCQWHFGFEGCKRGT